MTTRLFTGLVSLALLAAACSSAVDDVAVVDPDDLTTDLTVVLNAQVYTVDDQSPWASLFDLRDTAESPLAVLDRAVPDRPAIVLDNLGHAVGQIVPGWSWPESPLTRPIRREVPSTETVMGI